MTVTLHPFILAAIVCFAVALAGTLGWIGVNVSGWTEVGFILFALNSIIAFDSPHRPS